MLAGFSSRSRLTSFSAQPGGSGSIRVRNSLGLALILAGAAIPIMYWLSRRKLAVAEALGSRALRADAIEAVTCGYLSAVVLAGLAAQLLFDAWWIDSVTSLAVVWLLVKEGRQAWSDEECCH